MVPALKAQLLLSGSKFSKAGFISVCNKDKVNIYDRRTEKNVVSEESVLQGWRCPNTNIWHIILQENIFNANKHTILLDGPSVFELLNSMYAVPLSAKMIEHDELFNNDPTCPQATDAINNVYKLTSIKRAVRYLNGAACFLSKAT